MELPVVVEVLAPGLAGAAVGRPARGAPMGGCDLERSDDTFHLFRVLDRLREVFADRVVVHLLEPFSLPWIVRVVRFRPRRYPAFIVGGHELIAGLDERTLFRAVDARLGAISGAGHTA
ncbi:MAG: hypothetical protein QN183_02375 [Armatimonadota bacterium]|nr:hypothetical protein [Armatimonadota bacterium]MDR7532794.1 hypothetical protein [Armatimonadota bacterium]MDR7535201.1 hypothetical protein [Armatimonadota bacterium]